MMVERVVTVSTSCIGEKKISFDSGIWSRCPYTFHIFLAGCKSFLFSSFPNFAEPMGRNNGRQTDDEGCLCLSLSCHGTRRRWGILDAARLCFIGFGIDVFEANPELSEAYNTHLRRTRGRAADRLGVCTAFIPAVNVKLRNRKFGESFVEDRSFYRRIGNNFPIL